MWSSSFLIAASFGSKSAARSSITLACAHCPSLRRARPARYKALVFFGSSFSTSSACVIAARDLPSLISTPDRLSMILERKACVSSRWHP